jgi:hypothetical protein
MLCAAAADHQLTSSASSVGTHTQRQPDNSLAINMTRDNCHHRQIANNCRFFYTNPATELTTHHNTMNLLAFSCLAQIMLIALGNNHGEDHEGISTDGFGDRRPASVVFDS